MLVNTTNIYILACLFIILGLSATGAFSLLMTLFNLKTTNHQQSAAISGMSQSVGYVIAAIGPVTFGYIHNIIHAWISIIHIVNYARYFYDFICYLYK